MADEDVKESPGRELVAVFQPEVATYYSNVVNLSSSLTDIRVTFGKHAPIGEPTYDFAVYLSYPAAKQVSVLLQQMISSYEESFGQINLQPVETDDGNHR